MTLPLAISGVLSVLYFRVLVVLMSLLEDSATEVGYYVTSTRMVELFLALPVMLVSVVLPVLSVAARDDEGRLRYVTLRLAQSLGLLGVLLAPWVRRGAEPLIRLLGGDEYAGAAPVLQIQCVALVTIFVVGGWTTTPLVGMGRTRALVVTTAIGLAAVLVFGLILIPPLGAEGAAIAAVAGDLVYCAAVFVALHRAGPGRGLPPGPLLRVVAAALPALVVAVAKPPGRSGRRRGGGAAVPSAGDAVRSGAAGGAHRPRAPVQAQAQLAVGADRPGHPDPTGMLEEGMNW